MDCDEDLCYEVETVRYCMYLHDLVGTIGECEVAMTTTAAF